MHCLTGSKHRASAGQYPMDKFVLHGTCWRRCPWRRDRVWRASPWSERPGGKLGTLADPRTPSSRWGKAVRGGDCWITVRFAYSVQLYSHVKILKKPYPGVVESEAVEGQLEVQILVQLRHGGMDVELVVATSSVHVLVEVPVHKVAPELRKTGGGYGVSSGCRGVCGRRGDIVIGIWKQREEKTNSLERWALAYHYNFTPNPARLLFQFHNIIPGTCCVARHKVKENFFLASFAFSGCNFATHILAAPVPGAWPLKVTVNIHFCAANFAVFLLLCFSWPLSPNFASPLAF